MKGGVTHVQQTKEARYVAGRKMNVLPTAHRLRDTFATAAHQVRVKPANLMMLMNHSLPNQNVTEGYIFPDREDLREDVKKIAAFLLERMEGA